MGNDKKLVQLCLYTGKENFSIQMTTQSKVASLGQSDSVLKFKFYLMGGFVRPIRLILPYTVFKKHFYRSTYWILYHRLTLPIVNSSRKYVYCLGLELYSPAVSCRCSTIGSRYALNIFFLYRTLTIQWRLSRSTGSVYKTLKVLHGYHVQTKRYGGSSKSDLSDTHSHYDSLLTVVCVDLSHGEFLFNGIFTRSNATLTRSKSRCALVFHIFHSIRPFTPSKGCLSNSSCAGLNTFRFQSSDMFSFKKAVLVQIRHFSLIFYLSAVLFAVWGNDPSINSVYSDDIGHQVASVVARWVCFGFENFCKTTAAFLCNCGYYSIRAAIQALHNCIFRLHFLSLQMCLARCNSTLLFVPALCPIFSNMNCWFDIALHCTLTSSWNADRSARQYIVMTAFRRRSFLGFVAVWSLLHRGGYLYFSLSWEVHTSSFTILNLRCFTSGQSPQEKNDFWLFWSPLLVRAKKPL